MNTRKSATAFAASLLLCSLVSMFLPSPIQAETRRALIVGINTYRQLPPPTPLSAPGTTVIPKRPVATGGSQELGRGAWTNLDAGVNDAEAFKEVLKARFGFDESNILMLTEGEATRDNIMRGIREHLIDKAASGDMSVFFYAGHGSQVFNSKSDEDDKMDESLVPSDINKGGTDIRDKELARLWNQALAKGILVTAIFDSCHSGSIARGESRDDKARVGPPEMRDIADPPDSGPKPEQHENFLILSAAQEDQSAYEARALKHGAFTAAFLKTLLSVPVTESTEHVFAAVNGYMRAEGRTQQPVLGGTVRKRQPLFGKGSASLSGRLTLAVRSPEVKNGEVEIDGGSALNLGVGTELVSKRSPRDGEAAVRLQITRVESLSRSIAKVIQGDSAAIQPGDLLEVDRFVVPPAAVIRVWMPAGLPDEAGLRGVITAAERLRTSDRVEWVSDPTDVAPTHEFFWDKGTWHLHGPGGTLEALGVTPNLTAVAQSLGQTGGEKARLFVNLPPSVRLANAIESASAASNRAIEIVQTRGEADYFLVGRLAGETVEYAWVLPDAAGPGIAERLPLPVRTDWTRLHQNAGVAEPDAGMLQEWALRLGKIKGWLTLSSQADESFYYFPYRLALKQTGASQVIKAEGIAREGEVYGLVLRAEPEQMNRPITRRYVYVLSIDSKGKTSLWYPPIFAGNVENRHPEKPSAYPSEIPLGPEKLFVIGEPFGTDTYILLTSLEPLPNPQVLESEGVRTRGRSVTVGVTPETALLALFTGLGAGTRSPNKIVPANWSIERVSVTSVRKNAP